MKNLIEEEVEKFNSELVITRHNSVDYYEYIEDGKGVDDMRDFLRQSLTRAILATAERFKNTATLLSTDNKFNQGSEYARKSIFQTYNQINSELNGEEE